jgi:plastocyanin
MSSRVALAAVLVSGLLLALTPTAMAGPASNGLTATYAGSGATASTTTCTWKWRWKKRVRWVKRHGRKRKVVKYRKVKVKVCRTVTPPAPARLGVKSWEFGFTLSAKEIPAGDTIVELSNQGEDSHDLHIQRVDGGETLAAPETDPGGINRIRFTTTPGTYRLWCSLPFHAQRGMDTTITVD